MESHDHIMPLTDEEYNLIRQNEETILILGNAPFADDTEGETGFHDTHFGKFNRRPLKGFPIHTIGTSMDVIKQDVEALVAKVKAEPEKTFVIEDVGINKKSNIGVETMAPLFEPLKEMDNVFFVKEYWDFYNA